MSEHTPGPWKIGSSKVRVDCDDGTCFVIWPNANLSAEEIALTTRANARLIAAAPEMLDIVRRLAEWWENKEHPIGSLGIEAAELWAKMQKETGDAT